MYLTVVHANPLKRVRPEISEKNKKLSCHGDTEATEINKNGEGKSKQRGKPGNQVEK
jgi:hypothetical protein